ncbi:MAG TPA: alpha/beta hydrolase [Bacillota bacterium]
MRNHKINIWENLHYLGAADDGFQPTLTTYILNGNQLRPAVLICPGGGYSRVSPREAEPVALQYNAAGLHAFVLDYSVAPRKHPLPLRDVARAICLIRENAAAWQVNPEKIAVCGFSAGGHLAASLGVHWEHPCLKGVAGITSTLTRPNALILGYPVISFGPFRNQESFINLLGDQAPDSLLREFSLELQVKEETPPVFLWHSYVDQVVPVENTLLFANALRQKGIPFELHIFPDGPHGLSLATAETADQKRGVYPHVARWMQLCIEWLRETFKD